MHTGPSKVNIETDERPNAPHADRLARGWRTLLWALLLGSVAAAAAPLDSVKRASTAKVPTADSSKVIDATSELIASAAEPAGYRITVPGPSSISRELLHDAAAPSASPPPPESKVAPTAPAGRVIWMQVTAYCGCQKCCGPSARGLTASGKPITYHGGEFVAADTDFLAFGTRLMVPDYASGGAVEVVDRGGAIKGYRLDVFFPTHEQALAWGRRWVPVTVLPEPQHASATDRARAAKAGTLQRQD